jgi:hypothetical protein
MTMSRELGRVGGNSLSVSSIVECPQSADRNDINSEDGDRWMSGIATRLSQTRGRWNYPRRVQCHSPRCHGENRNARHRGRLDR